MLVRCIIRYDAKQVIQCKLRKRDRFVHCIQIVRVHRRYQLTDQVKALRVRKRCSLILVHLPRLVLKIVRLATVWRNLQDRMNVEYSKREGGRGGKMCER